MKWAVIFANKGDCVTHLDHIKNVDYCFIVEGECDDTAFINWEVPKDSTHD
jgi:hypothetical protein